MLDSILVSRKEISKLKVSLKNPLGLTCEKITQTPRVFATSQIKNAVENILVIYNTDENTPKLLLKAAEYVLKDLFLYMHQTGLYNRQFNLWTTLGNIRQMSIFKVGKSLFKGKEAYCYIIDFFIDEKVPCIKTIIQANGGNNKDMYNDFKTCLSWAIKFSKLNRLKGVIYFLKDRIEPRFLEKLDVLTNAFDPISKYESVINKTSDLRLNIVTYKEENENYNFEHIYPEIRVLACEDVRVRK